MVAGSKAESLYDVLQVARTWPKPSTSDGPPLPKRHRHAPNAMISSLTAQELKAMASDLSAQEHRATTLDMTAQEIKGACQNRGPSLTCLTPHRCSYTYWDGTYACQHKWLPVGLSLPGWGMPWISCCHLYPCAPCPSGHKTVMSFLSCNFFFNSNALKQHGKQAPWTAFSCHIWIVYQDIYKRNSFTHFSHIQLVITSQKESHVICCSCTLFILVFKGIMLLLCVNKSQWSCLH